jgi:hypothetical protein
VVEQHVHPKQSGFVTSRSVSAQPEVASERLYRLASFPIRSSCQKAHWTSSRNLKRFLASRKKRPISAVVTRKLIRISAHCSTHRIVVRFAEFGLGPRDRIKRPGNRRKNSNDF